MVRGQLTNVVNTVLVSRARSSHKIAEASDANFGCKGGTTGIKVAGALLDSEVRTRAPVTLTNVGIGHLLPGWSARCQCAGRWYVRRF